MACYNPAACRAFATLQAMAVSAGHIGGVLSVAFLTSSFDWFNVLSMGPVIAADVTCNWFIALGLIQRASVNATSSGDEGLIVLATVASSAMVFFAVRVLGTETRALDGYDEFVRRIVAPRSDLYKDDRIIAGLLYMFVPMLVWPITAGISFAVWQRLVRHPVHVEGGSH